MEDKTEYLTIKQGAVYLDCSVQFLHRQTQKGIVQYRMIRGIKRTTKEWLDSYRENKYDKQVHARFNQQPVFDPLLGEYSVRNVAELLGCKVQHVYNEIKYGRLKYLKRGVFKVVTQKMLKDYVKNSLPKGFELKELTG